MLARQNMFIYVVRKALSVVLKSNRRPSSPRYDLCQLSYETRHFCKKINHEHSAFGRQKGTEKEVKVVKCKILHFLSSCMVHYIYIYI